MNLKYNGHFDELHFSDSCFDPPIIEGNLIIIGVTGIIPMAGHPIGEKMSIYDKIKGRLIFTGAISSEREVIEWIEEDKFKEMYVVKDGPFPSLDSDLPIFEFGFEGAYSEPHACIDWVIKAQAFTLEVTGFEDIRNY